MKKLLLMLLCLGLVGCASGGILKLSPDTYMISRSSAAGMFANMSRLKAKVIQDANEFADKQNKVAIPLSYNEVRPVHGFPSVEYQFRVVNKNDPEARRTHLVPRPDLTIQRDDSLDADINVDIKTKDESEEDSDIYSELIKLEDLRERGILTDEEFQAQKSKLLNR